MNKNLILTYCENYDEIQIRPFCESLYKNVLKKRTDTDACMIYKNVKIPNLSKFEYQYDCRIRLFQNTKNHNSHINTYRHDIFADFLEKSKNRYENVFIVDIRDIIFQTDNFLDTISNNIVVYSEDKFLSKHPDKNKWEEDCYKLLFPNKGYDYDKMINGEYYCAGTIFGPTNDIIKFLKQIYSTCVKYSTTEFLQKNFSLETAVFNNILKCYPPKNIDFRNNHSDEVLSFSRIQDTMDSLKTENGLIINSNNRPFSILHFNGMKTIPPKYLTQIDFSDLVSTPPHHNKPMIKRTLNHINESRMYKRC